MKEPPVVLRLLVGLLIAPWVLLVGLARIVRGVARFPARLRAGTADTIACPVGHPNAVLGRWTCKCGGNFFGHVFGPCPLCRLPAGWIACETCGLAIRSPWKDR